MSEFPSFLRLNIIPWQKYTAFYFYLKIKKNLYNFKVTINLQLLQINGYILWVVAYFTSNILYLPCPHPSIVPPTVTTSLFSMSVSASVLLYSLACCIF